MSELSHVPVLFDSHADVPSVFDVLNVQPGDDVLDCTLGLGGHAKRFCELVGKDGTVTGLDADSDNQTLAIENLKGEESFAMIHANFSMIADLDLPPFDIIFADLGLSSPHLDDPSRGFSFRFDGPLDLRLDRTRGLTAADLLATITEKELFETFADLGEISGSTKLAKHLVELREKNQLITTTADLKKAVEDVFQWKANTVLAQVFQALRMKVNNELGALEALLSAIPHMLKPGGRAGIISFHSLEDRMVKQTFKEWTTAEKDDVTGQDKAPAPFILLTKKAISPSEPEIAQNPRSRSAKFRAVQKAL